mgnify:FL=1
MIKKLEHYKFVIVGVESTGKSTCAHNVAVHFQATLATEYARDYLEEFGNEYDYEDFIKIANGQLIKEKKAESNKNNKITIFDTDFIVIYIWAKIVFNKIEPWIIDRINEYKDRIYFVMSPDVAWINDGLREYPDLEVRRNIHRQYVELLNKLKFQYYIIEGNDHEAREKEVIARISRIMA